jgi:hypothetical protein
MNRLIVAIAMTALVSSLGCAPAGGIDKGVVEPVATPGSLYEEAAPTLAIDGPIRIKMSYAPGSLGADFGLLDVTRSGHVVSTDFLGAILSSDVVMNRAALDELFDAGRKVMAQCPPGRYRQLPWEEFRKSGGWYKSHMSITIWDTDSKAFWGLDRYSEVDPPEELAELARLVERFTRRAQIGGAKTRRGPPAAATRVTLGPYLATHESEKGHIDVTCEGFVLSPRTRPLGDRRFTQELTDRIFDHATKAYVGAPPAGVYTFAPDRLSQPCLLKIWAGTEYDLWALTPADGGEPETAPQELLRLIDQLLQAWGEWSVVEYPEPEMTP